jgi:hypothetical protein
MNSRERNQAVLNHIEKVHETKVFWQKYIMAR